MNTDSSQMLYPDFTPNMQPFPAGAGPMGNSNIRDYFDLYDAKSNKTKIIRNKEPPNFKNF